MSSFTLFMKENHNNDKSLIENVRHLRDKWAQLSEVEKEKYRMISQRNMEQYKVEMAKWEAQMIAEGKPHLVRSKTLKPKKGKSE
ncbi:unnamed protein product [Ceutorhynchus assimilis]|uniref:HMG box domain-containing protein n=1 Tax=Ceutorhynchus assimilis TaxID=467358 RepID=A0A9N9MYA4_9CUCU|nr:unnamed protein product [Ceutorhynchus assimilis]